MGLSLFDLEKAMAPISRIGKGELEFEVQGTRVVLRTLTPEEEIEVQRNATSVLAGGEISDQVTGLEYLDGFRRWSLAYSLVQLGDTDFRNEDTIETGEKLPNGKPVRILRHEALYQLIKKSWSKPMLSGVFAKFGELMNKTDRESEDLIEFDHVDFDAEIARLEERIRELKEDKIRSDASRNDSRKETRNRVLNSSSSRVKSKLPEVPESSAETSSESLTVSMPLDEAREVVDEESEGDSDLGEGPETSFEAPEEEEAHPPPNERKPVFARASPAPQRPSPPVSFQAPTPSPTPNQAPEPVIEGGGKSLPVFDSFVDTSDSDAMAEAVEAENQRIAAMRKARSAPHFPAKKVAEEIAAPKSAGTKDGIPVFKMPEEVMTDRRPPPKAASPEKAPEKTGANPRFRPVVRK